jgi:hypothetical protein
MRVPIVIDRSYLLFLLFGHIYHLKEYVSFQVAALTSSAVTIMTHALLRHQCVMASLTALMEPMSKTVVSLWIETSAYTWHFVPELAVRLSNGDNGIVEIRYKGIWGTICDDYFGSFDALVLCRMLGYK